MMRGLRGLIFGVLIGYIALLIRVQAQDQSGFISLDCGLPPNESYTEDDTKLDYISDARYIDSGESKYLSSSFRDTHRQHYWYLRSFPQGIRNCYTISVSAGTKYLIRASFWYGNYDGLNQPPQFDLYFESDYWYTVELTTEFDSDYQDIIHVPTKKEVDLCIINTGHGTPFISSIELRPLPNNTYKTVSGSLNFLRRSDIGSTYNYSIRFDSDVYDRIWGRYTDSDWTILSTPSNVDPFDNYQIPSDVLRTAATPTDGSGTMDLSFQPSLATTKYYIYMYFAEVVKLEANQSRGFNVVINGDVAYEYLVPKYLSATSIFTPTPKTGGSYKISLVSSDNSTLPPIINAIELYTSITFSALQTYKADVDAIKKIKSTYGLKKSWQSDPCFPKAYPWAGLNCSDDEPPRITFLNLSSSGLTGVISPDISNLPFLQTLDLSNNNLTGEVPAFLSGLENLKVLNLENNMLNGSIPPGLIKRSKDGSLLLSFAGNPKLDACADSSCLPGDKEKKKNNIVIPIVAAIGGLVAIVIVIVIILFVCRRRKSSTSKPDKKVIQPESYVEIQSIGRASTQAPDSFETKRRQFSYAEVVKMTNNFKTTLGRGGFGTVYHGFIDDIQVAVKVLSTTTQSEQQFERGYQQFLAEVKLLMRVHHRNLTNLVGYFNEGTNIGLIYEYMAKGNLAEHLSESSPKVLTWEERLRIATDSAQGLEYLHDNCQPPIIHRDVKTTNILLTENLQGKLADFGLSKINPVEGTHISTVVAGTPGYLDPEYYRTNRLTEKSDVYSFGVALLEIITCRPVVTRTQGQDMVHITKWVSSMIANGDIKNIVDPRLKGNYNTNSVWRAVEIAMNCVKMEQENRPTMNQVVAELKGCLAPELYGKQGSPLQSTDSIEMISAAVVDESRPMAR